MKEGAGQSNLIGPLFDLGLAYFIFTVLLIYCLAYSCLGTQSCLFLPVLFILASGDLRHFSGKK